MSAASSFVLVHPEAPRMGNLVLIPREDMWAYDAYRKGKRVGLVTWRDFQAGKARLHRGRRARREAKLFSRRFQ